MTLLLISTISFAFGIGYVKSQKKEKKETLDYFAQSMLDDI
ncbi:hypothetical protein [Flammeovirga pectinis]|nr:hypothetical protein [Flammeovirga pectinis]